MIFPTTGPLARLGDPARAGVRVAVDDVNAAGGVLGVPLQLTNGDSGDGSVGPTEATVEEAVNAGADLLVGGLAADDTTALVDSVTTAGLVLISPGSAGTINSPGATSGLFFRLSPPVSIQGDVLASAVADDGVTQATVVYMDDEDGHRDRLGLCGGVRRPRRHRHRAHRRARGRDGRLGHRPDDRAAGRGLRDRGRQLHGGRLVWPIRGPRPDPMTQPTYVSNINPALIETSA